MLKDIVIAIAQRITRWNTTTGSANQTKRITGMRVECRIMPQPNPIEITEEFKGERRKIISYFATQDELIKVIIENG